MTDSKHTPTGGPAFPGNESYIDEYSSSRQGMCLRDWLAGQAIVGVMHSFTGDGWHNPNEYQIERFVHTAYKIADGMLAESARAEAANIEARKKEMDDDRPF